MAEIVLNRDQALAEIKEMVAELESRQPTSGGGGIATAESMPRSHRFESVDNEEIFRKLIEVETAIYGPPRTTDSNEFTRTRTPRGPNILQKNSDAVVALVPNGNLDPQGPGLWTLKGRTAGEDFDLCPEEPFFDRLAAATGTGVLVGKRTILTAWHLVFERSNGTVRSLLPNLTFLFGYEKNRTQFTDQDVFEGARARVTAQNSAREEDWALIELDREVGRDPVAIRAGGEIGDEDEVYVIGHPLGIAKQAAGEAQVQNNSDPRHFFANLDVYERNSGSPVFNASDHLLEGIVFAGDNPLFALPRRACKRTRRCRGEDCQGPAIVRISRIASSDEFRNRK